MSWPDKRCDFDSVLGCSDSFECPSAVVHTNAGAHDLRGPWFACALCSILIQQQQWPKLVARTVRRFLEVRPSADPRTVFETAWNCVDTFRTARGSAAA